ncbi:competence/damage-inducible protein A [Fimbriimonas ginsengisoli]|uniref:CinA-like protein n=1 Tax=Fimbriimonas ginsengisoli Gsoil 348 TaxID=661478 RepID=A0A068NRD5_FIMGI|nr:competence/damage-inducible protein A [Fimbriimonas ginsengisoli]AIE85942.1 Molybdopterin binding motif, CinA N-terminal domain / C-terminal domain of CinA type S [Fimbriimonas ginsengisoli Gsoil 348]
MTAEIVSVGTELLLGQIVDTHAPVMARILAECGIGCTRRTTIGDNWDRLVSALKEALERADVLITIGGLGPTVDDLTRDAIAAALGDELEKVPEMEAKLREFFSSRNIRWTESIARQAEKPTSARLIDNPNGTAPGLLCEKNGKIVIGLPGPKGEFDPMAYGPVKDYLETIQGAGVIHSRTLRIIGMGESHVEERVRALMDAENPTVAPYAHTGEVHLRITARAATREDADRMLDPLEDEIRRALGHHLYGTDETTLEAAVIAMLKERGETIAVAESMTGGELAARLTAVPGASAAVVGGAVAYSVAAKQAALGVDSALLASAGPVSGEVAEAMALGAQRAFGSTYALAITGNAGPTADAGDRPIGLTFIALATPNGVTVQEQRYRGLREDIRRRATQQALATLRQALL